MSTDTRLINFPVSFFSVIMGLMGFTIVLQRVEILLSLDHGFSTAVLVAVALIFTVITVLYAVKLFYCFSAVTEEFNHPVRLNFFPTFSISLLLFSIALLEVSGTASFVFWIAGAGLHFTATIVILSLWIRQTKFELNHFNPSWFIPIVGNLLVPIAGTTHVGQDLLWFFYSIGFIFWILLFTIFFYRIIFNNPIPEKLLPTFFILIAPPSLGFVSYVKLTGAIDSFAKILYFFALFLVVLLLSQWKMFYRIEFYLSWWAYSFPLASIAIATALMHLETGIVFYRSLFFVLVFFLTALIGVLLVFTLKGILRGEICVQEG